MADWKATIRRKYGMTIEEYDRLFDEQDGVCAICGRTNGNKRLAVDHDHTTGWVRGLLCHSCNVAIGLLGDDIERVAAMLEYLS